jgi:NAD(P)-dependent dehydrogenase (short-subunit alcohol dehydrogenase family)
LSKKWTSANIPDLTGKVIIVTGANSGVGYETAKELARKGAQTIFACRSMQKGQTAIDLIRQEIPTAPVEIMPLDLASLASVRTFAETFKSKFDRLDILVNNAGILWVPYGKTEDGFERQFGTNYLGHFALTGLLIDLIQKNPKARVVTVSSVEHYLGVINFDDLMDADANGKKYRRQKAYSRSKLANLLFTYELQRRLEAMKSDAIATAAHPGVTSTNMLNSVRYIWILKIFLPLAKKIFQSAAMGTLPTLRAAVDPDAKGGQYFGPYGFLGFGGTPVVVPSSKASHDLEDARKLWEVSEELTGVNYL